MHASNLTLERLRPLPVHRDDEVWEVGLVQFPATPSVGDDEAPSACVACASTKGGVAMTPITTLAGISGSAPLEAVARFALDPHVPGAKPLNYLPSRVATGPMPEALEERFAQFMGELGIRVEVKQPLPNLDEFLEFMMAKMESFAPIDAPSLLGVRGMTVERLASFADAARLFWEAEPWQHFTSEVAWEIHPRPRSKAMRTCSVMGSGGEEFGLGFLPSASAFMDLSMQAMDDPMSALPRGPIWSMTYTSVEQAPTADQDAWLTHSLPLAAPEAFPLPLGVNITGTRHTTKRPSCKQLALMEALLRGFAASDGDLSQVELLEFDAATFDGRVHLELVRAADLGHDVMPIADADTTVVYDAQRAPDPAAWLAASEDERVASVLRYHRNLEEPHPDLPDPDVHAAMHSIVETQIAFGDELPVRATAERFMSQGLDRHDAIHAIAWVLTQYIFDSEHAVLEEDPESAYYAGLERLTPESWHAEAGDGAAHGRKSTHPRRYKKRKKRRSR